MSERLDELIEGHLDGSLSDAEEAELESILARDAGACERLARATIERHLLAETIGGRRAAPVKNFPRRTILAPIAAAAAFLFGLSLLLWYRGGNPEIAPIEVGTVARGEVRGAARPAEKILHEGRYFAATDSEVTIGGATLRFLSPTTFTASTPPGRDGRAIVRLESGRLRADVENGLPGPTIETPKGRLRDIGTVYEVAVTPEGGVDGMSRMSRWTGLVSAWVLAGVLQFEPAAAPAEALLIQPDTGRVTLEDDGSIAKVRDIEGAAYLRAAASPRWTALREGWALDPGDWLKTSSRGANAMVVQLANDVRLTVGPGTDLELTSLEALRIGEGEIEIVAPEGAAFTVSGPDGSSQRIDGGKARVVTSRNGRLSLLESEPRWLTGYRSDAVTGSVGSLLAEMDGRIVPLEMGYHKVKVHIRDQLALTVIEESFINRTVHEIEGNFIFPLPADASVSGFSVWFGDEKVEGEIVEKARARAIYEQLLAEKKDPGLLEWSGGNLFKARVAGITGTKRVEIRYTQSLAGRNSTFRYDHALMSDLLRTHPLAQIEIVVDISSRQRLVDVRSPSHACRIQNTGAAARVEFSAESYVPTRDFRVDVSVEPEPSGIVFLPHVRDRDGWFMARIAAPEARADSNGRSARPLDLSIVVDTSQSMSGANREQALRTLEALLDMLGDQDTYNVSTTDTVTRFAFDAPAHPTKANRAAALAFASARHPLGWSDLDGAFDVVFGRAAQDTHVVYIGDGLVTKGSDIAPGSFIARMRGLHRGRGHVHTIGVGNAVEALVLQDLALLGSGSTRTVRSIEDATMAANDLFTEMTQPALHEVRVTFDGVGVAAVYPERLPNVPAGTETLIVGRFDPRSPVTSGTIRLTGTFDGEAVERSASISTLTTEDTSFVPRLWARRHMDHLQRQGGSSARAQIIALSEDFQIISPFTSLLVIEDEAERARFKLSRRFRMRDGEEFFAESAAAVRAALERRMLLASMRWRNELRKTIIASFQDLGVALTETVLRPTTQGPWTESASTLSLGMMPGSNSRQAGIGGDGLYALERQIDREDGFVGGLGKAIGGRLESKREKNGESFGLEDASSGDEAYLGDYDVEFAQAAVVMDELSRDLADKRPSHAGNEQLKSKSFLPSLEFEKKDRASRSNAVGSRLSELLPHLADRPARARRYQDLPEDLAKLLAELDTRSWIAGLSGGLEISVESAWYDARDRISTAQVARALISGASWWTESPHSEGDATFSDALVDGRRVLIREPWSIGCSRAAMPGDERDWSDVTSVLFTDVDRLFGDFDFESITGDGGIVTLHLRQRFQPTSRYEVNVDRAKRTVTSTVIRIDGEIFQTTSFSDFVEVEGRSFPTTSIQSDAKGRTIGRRRFAVAARDATTFAARMAEMTASLEKALIVPEFASYDVAFDRIARSEATLSDHWQFLVRHAAKDHWVAAARHESAILEAARGKAAGRVIELALLRDKRRNDEALRAILDIAASIVATPIAGESTAAEQLVTIANDFGAAERLRVVEAVEPVWRRQTHGFASLRADRELLHCYRMLSEPERVLNATTSLIEKYTDEVSVHLEHTRALTDLGRVDDATAHLGAIEKKVAWTDDERRTIFAAAVDIRANEYRLPDVAAEVARQLAVAPELVGAWGLQRYLGSLVLLGRTSEAERIVASWLDLAKSERLSAFDVERLQAAVDLLIGQGWLLRSRRLVDSNAVRLVEFAQRVVDRTDDRGLWSRLATNHDLGRTAAMRGALAAMRDEVLASFDSMSLYPLARRLEALLSNGVMAPLPGWNTDDRLSKVVERWSPGVSSTVDDAMQGLLERFAGPTVRLGALMKRRDAARSRVERNRFDREIFAVRLLCPWTETIEKDLLSSVATLSHEAPEDIAITLRIIDLRSVIERLVAERTRIASVAGEVAGETRRQRNVRIKATKKVAQSAVAEALRANRPNDAAISSWFDIERLTITVRAGGDMSACVEEALALLRPLLAKKFGNDGPTTTDRLAATRLLHIVVAPIIESDDATSVEGVLTHLSSLGTPDKRLVDLDDWRLMILTAANRVADAMTLIRDPSKQPTPSRAADRSRLLARLLTSEGKYEDARSAWREAMRLAPLESDECAEVATIETALENREAAVAARRGIFEDMEEWRLANWISNRINALKRGSDSSLEIDEDLVQAFDVIFSKSTSISWHVQLLGRAWEATKDFRLLGCLPRAVVGQSSQRIYEILAASSALIGRLNDEASLDRLVESVAKERTSATTDVDRRALDMVEFLAAYRAMTQKVGGDAWRPRVKAAFDGTLQRTWSRSEPRYFLEFFAGLEAIADRDVVDRVLEVAARFVAEAPSGSEDRFALATAKSDFEWKQSEQDASIATLADALADLRKTRDDLLPSFARNAGRKYWWRLFERGRGVDAEDFIDLELGRKYHADHRAPWEIDWFDLAREALARGIPLRSGEGSRLYASAMARAVAALARDVSPQHCEGLVSGACNLMQTWWKSSKEARIADDLETMMLSIAPPLIARHRHDTGVTIVRRVAATCRQVIGARRTVEFMVSAAENEPSYLESTGRGFWTSHCYFFGEQVVAAGEEMNSELVERVMRIVEREMRADFESTSSSSRVLFHRDYSHFWGAMKPRFRTIALDVVAAKAGDEAIEMFVADYLDRGVSDVGAAADVGYAVYRRGAMSSGGRLRLCNYLERTSRWTDLLRVSGGLVDEFPQNVEAALYAIRAAFRLGQAVDVTARLERFEKEFLSGTLAAQSTRASYAWTCVEITRFERAAALYGELVAEITRQQGAGVPNSTAASYWSQIALCHQKLGNTAKAVDAASAAVVASGRSERERNETFDRLVKSLDAAKDFDAWLAGFEAEVARTGFDNPTLRRAIGRSEMNRNRAASAVANFERALEANPSDDVVRTELIEACVAAKDVEKEIGAMLARAEQVRTDPSRWMSLAWRLNSLEREEERERAITTVIEIAPSEGRHHAIVAEARERLRDPEAALTEWARAVELEPKNAEHRLGRLRLLIELGRKMEAEKELAALRTGEFERPPENLGRRIDELAGRLR